MQQQLYYQVLEIVIIQSKYVLKDEIIEAFN